MRRGLQIMEVVLVDSANLTLFVGAALVLLLIPGPAVLYIIGRSMEQGRLAGVVSTLGIHAATLLHVLAAALGVSTVLLSSALAFNVVKYGGAVYLIALGLQKILGPVNAAQTRVPLAGRGHWRLFRDGFIVNLLNPKTALFFFAFLPQFVDLSRGHVSTQIIVFGLIFASLGLITDGCYALLAGTAGSWLRRRRSYLSVERYVSGTLFIGLGLTTASTGVQEK